MRVLNSFIKAVGAVALLGGSSSGTAATDGGYSDTCAEVGAELKVPQPLIPKNLIGVGMVTEVNVNITGPPIEACICVHDIPTFITTNAVAIAGVALAGKTYVISAMVKPNGKVCNYPDHAVASRAKNAPCNFHCKDGYQPYPSQNPTKYVCNPPYSECSGKCGIYQGCPSGKPHYRRDSFSRELLCPAGMEACGIWGRNARSWECVDTMNDLESCGGCVFPLPNGDGREGQDCTALPGVSDVSCVRGRCMPGRNVRPDKAECVYNEDEDPKLLAAQYGLDIPLGTE